jgi:hypothetical protein
MWILTIVFTVGLNNLLLQAQVEERFSIKKISCKNPFGGYKLIINDRGGNLIISSDSDGYALNSFVTLNDSDKLNIVFLLLSFEDDTSKCCLMVSRYDYNGLDGDYTAPKSQQYNVQIDALFMINRLCFPSLFNVFSNKPVLVNRKTGIEINENYKELKLVYKQYRKWYLKCKRTGKINQNFPFNDGEFKWLGGRSPN